MQRLARELGARVTATVLASSWNGGGKSGSE